MRVLGILFYAAILVLIGLAMIVFAFVFSFNKLQPQSVQYINDLLLVMQDNLNARIIVGLSGLLLILISFSFAQLILGRFQREKTIAFKTSSGEVTIALSAVEDLIKRLANLIPGVKELRPDVRAGKKGIIVELRVVLKSEANIPGLTERLEEMTKSKLQELLGIEEKVSVNTHIVKIISAEEKDRRKKELGNEGPSIPFGGYGRV